MKKYQHVKCFLQICITYVYVGRIFFENFRFQYIVPKWHFLEVFGPLWLWWCYPQCNQKNQWPKWFNPRNSVVLLTIWSLIFFTAIKLLEWRKFQIWPQIEKILQKKLTTPPIYSLLSWQHKNRHGELVQLCNIFLHVSRGIYYLVSS